MTSTKRKDADIKKDILDELSWRTPQVNADDIGVIVDDGAVRLTGIVPYWYQKDAVKKAVKRIKGVCAIVDDIEVKLPSQLEGSDEDIAHRIAKLFDWNIQIPGDDIDADVHEGRVTITGEVNWQFQRNYVQRQIEGIKGVKSVLNNITLRKQSSSSDIKNEIIKALHRHASLEAKNVKVSVAGGTVTLEGNVDNYFDLDLIEDAVWAAPGVQKVVDKMSVY